MRKGIVLISFFFALLLSSCKPAEEGNVKIKTGGIFEPVEIEIVDGVNRGEFLIGSEPDIITVRVKNNSSYSLTDLNLILEDELSTAGMKFNPNDEGKSQSPGYMGTCSSILKSRSECYFKLYYSPTISGDLFQDVIISYKNLVDSHSEGQRITMLAGEAASLVFTSEQINYSFGIIERTDRGTYKERLIIENTGGLTAKNMSFGMLNNPNSGAYVVTENTCGTELKAKQKCEVEVVFSPMNYDGSAPDGNVDLFYYSSITIPYIRDPDGGKSALNAYFSVKSYNIRGDIKVAGLSSINFDTLVVGNFDTKSFKIKNDGDKESILHYFKIKDSLGTVVAACVKVAGSDLLECRDPASINTPGATVALPMLPFKIRDNNNCITPYDSLSYTRDASGALSDDAVVEIAGVVDGQAGQSCLFDMIFHPSVEFTASGDFNNWSIGLVYDSTWKNLRDIKGELPSTPSMFTIARAQYTAAAVLSSAFFEYAGDSSYPNLDTDDNGIFSYDLGRVSLISSAAYKQQAKFRLKNLGDNIAEIISVRDGSVTPFVFTDTSQNLNNYYQSASHSGCSFISPSGGECDVRFQLAPLASTNANAALAKAEEDGQMYDDAPNQQKKFFIEYKDGTTYNDDLTLRSNRLVEIKMAAKLVRKGFLVFEDTSPSQGVLGQKVSGNTEFMHIKLKNVGTGPIPYIESVEGKDLVRVNTGQFPYEVVDRATGEGGATKDCYDLINFNPASQPVSSTPSLGSLQAGENCSFTVKMRLRQTDRITLSQYDDTSRPEWNRHRLISDNNTNEAWEFDQYNSNDQILSFRYFDGDGTPDVANGYSPDVENYGNKYTIGGGSNGDYRVNIRFGTQGKMIPRNPLPSVSAILYRSAVNLPAIPMDGWGESLSAATVGEKWLDISNGAGNIPATFFSRSKVHLASASLKSNAWEYIYHGGTYNVGGTYKGSVDLVQAGMTSATNLTIASATGDSEITAVRSGAKLNFTFSPTSDGLFSKDVVVQYKGGRKNLDNEATLSYSDVVTSYTIRVYFEATPEVRSISLSSQYYTVSYNSGTNSVEETLDGLTENYTLEPSKVVTGQSSTVRAIKGSEVYGKKRFFITNNGNATINRVDAMIKQSFDAPVVQNVSGGLGYSVSANTCSNKSLNVSETCYIDVKLKASTSEPDLTSRVLYVTYETATDQYLASAIDLKFESANPAKVKVANISPENINNPLGGVIQGSYPISFGFYTAVTHPILNAYPKQVENVNNVILQNTALEKASFLHQYRTYVNNMSATIPAGASIKIYDDGENAVFAARPCFYGDDEGGPLPVDEWGFNSSTVSSCTLTIEKSFDDKFIGENLPASQNFVGLTFYNSGRASIDTLYLHFKGFVQPNKSTVSNVNLENVISEDSGDLTFSWDDFTETNLAWGNITGYRVFYSASKSVLNNIYTTSASYVNTLVPSVEINGLLSGRYYYIKIAAIRMTPGGKEFLSESNMGVIELVVPPTDSFYDYDLKVVIDKYMSPRSSPRFGTKSEVSAGCNSEIVNVIKNGAAVTKSKKLVTTAIFDLIKADPLLSDYTYQIVPHWMADNTVDIEPIFAPSFLCTDQSGSDAGNTTFYQKSCADCSCNLLSKIEGGDGESLPPSAILYIDGEATSAAQRCYFSQ